jgi:hypothetical protein
MMKTARLAAIDAPIANVEAVVARGVNDDGSFK